MKKIFSIVLVIMAVVSPLRAEIETTVGADVVSEYIFRGVKCGDAAVQPTLAVSAGGFEASAWGITYGIILMIELLVGQIQIFLNIQLFHVLPSYHKHLMHMRLAIYQA